MVYNSELDETSILENTTITIKLGTMKKNDKIRYAFEINSELRDFKFGIGSYCPDLDNCEKAFDIRKVIYKAITEAQINYFDKTGEVKVRKIIIAHFSNELNRLIEKKKDIDEFMTLGYIIQCGIMQLSAGELKSHYHPDLMMKKILENLLIEVTKEFPPQLF